METTKLKVDCEDVMSVLEVDEEHAKILVEFYKARKARRSGDHHAERRFEKAVGKLHDAFPDPDKRTSIINTLLDMYS